MDYDVCMNDTAALPSSSTTRLWPQWTATLAILALMIVILKLMGRIWWCEQGDWAIYIPHAWQSSHTSQHVADPYTWTHMLHGIFFYWVALAILCFTRWKKSRPAMAWAFVAAMFIEAAWEVLENTPWVIDKYRANTASLDYFGDTVINSTGDALACALGFYLATRIGWKWSIALFVAVELALLWWIRDNLTLNVIMLLWPLQIIKDWQVVVQG